MRSGALRSLKHSAKRVGITVERFGPHTARAAAATNALDQGADIAKIQEWLGHANVSTTRIYDHRKTPLEDSPVFKVIYRPLRGERQFSTVSGLAMLTSIRRAPALEPRTAHASGVQTGGVTNQPETSNFPEIDGPANDRRSTSRAFASKSRILERRGVAHYSRSCFGIRSRSISPSTAKSVQPLS